MASRGRGAPALLAPLAVVAQARDAVDAAGAPRVPASIYADLGRRQPVGEHSGTMAEHADDRAWALVLGDVLNDEGGQEQFGLDEVVVRVAYRDRASSGDRRLFHVGPFDLGTGQRVAEHLIEGFPGESSLADDSDTAWRD